MNKPIKYLTFGLKLKTGINFTGKKTFKTRGSGRSKRLFRFIDFYRENYLVTSYIIRIEYDPNRSANIALICYKNGILSYIIANDGLKENTFLNNNYKGIGTICLLGDLKFGTFISCIELRSNFGAKLIRSAGCYGVVLHKNLIDNKVIVRLPSGEERYIQSNSKVALGIISNIDHKLKKKVKAGNNIWLGKKPKVRGVAKNCVDHPHGGGRGKTSPLVLASNFTRKVLKGVPSSSNMFINNKLIVKSRKNILKK